MVKENVNEAEVFRSESASFLMKLSSLWAYQSLKRSKGYIGRVKLR